MCIYIYTHTVTYIHIYSLYKYVYSLSTHTHYIYSLYICVYIYTYIYREREGERERFIIRYWLTWLWRLQSPKDLQSAGWRPGKSMFYRLKAKKDLCRAQLSGRRISLFLSLSFYSGWECGLCTRPHEGGHLLGASLLPPTREPPSCLLTREPPSCLPPGSLHPASCSVAGRLLCHGSGGTPTSDIHIVPFLQLLLRGVGVVMWPWESHLVALGSYFFEKWGNWRRWYPRFLPVF